MIAVDSSVVIAGFASWHEKHALASTVLRKRPRLIAHAAVETYSVLTRLPSPHRVPANLVDDFLRERFTEPLLCLSSEGHRDLIAAMAKSRVHGGAIYDGLIGMTAAEHDLTLVTLDTRASRTYEAVGASSDLIE